MKAEHRTILVRKYARNIARTYREAPAKVRNRACDWYEVESDKLADLALELGLPFRSVCGAAAAISPGMRWELVPGYVDAIWRNDGAVQVPTYSRLFVERALGCLRGENPDDVLGGPKVRAFYALLYTRGQSDSVVIDGHAFNIARGERAPLRGKVPAAARVSIARYRMAEEAYRIAAARLGVAPHAVQAVTWTHWRIAQGVTE